jgi:hypothetical protein
MNTLSTYRVEKQTRRNQPTSFGKMEAIACGVQARFEESTGYSKKVTDETITVARALGVADSEIERWATHRLSRLASDTERLREIKLLLNKVYGSGLNAMAKSTRA